MKSLTHLVVRPGPATCLLVAALALPVWAPPALADRECTAAEREARYGNDPAGECGRGGAFFPFAGDCEPADAPNEVLKACFGWIAGEDDAIAVGEPVLFCDGSFREPVHDWCWRFRGTATSGCDSDLLGLDETDSDKRRLRQRFPCYVYETGGTAEVTLDVRRDEGIAFRVSDSASSGSFEICEPRIVERNSFVVSGQGGEVLIPVEAPAGCQWSLDKITGNRTSRIEGVGPTDIWITVEPGKSPPERIEVVPEGARQPTGEAVSGVDPVRFLQQRRRFLRREGQGGNFFLLPYFACPDDGFSCEGRAGAPIFLLPDGPAMSPAEYSLDGRLGLIDEAAGDHPVYLVGTRDGGRAQQRRDNPGWSLLSCRGPSLLLEGSKPATELDLLRSAFGAAEVCRDNLTKCLEDEGECEPEERTSINLNAYRAQALVDDLEALRRAIGAESVILWGEGFGSQLALAYLFKYAAFVESAILHAPRPLDKITVEPADLDAVLTEIDGRASRNRSLVDQIDQLKDELAAEAAVLTVTEPAPGAEYASRRTVVERERPLGELDLRQTVAYWLLDRRRTNVHLKRNGTIRAIRRGKKPERFSPVADFVSSQAASECDATGGPVLQARRIATRGECLGSALTFAPYCSMPRGRDTRGLRLETVLGRALESLFPEICAAFDLRNPLDFQDCTHSGACPQNEDPIDVLLIRGELDPLSTAADLEAVRKRLESERLFETVVDTVVVRPGLRSDSFDPRLEPTVRGLLTDGATGSESLVDTPDLFSGTTATFDSALRSSRRRTRPPRGIKASRLSGTEMRLSWRRPTDNDTFVLVETRTSAGRYREVARIISRAHRTRITGLEAGRDYWVRLRTKAQGRRRSRPSEPILLPTTGPG